MGYCFKERFILRENGEGKSTEGNLVLFIFVEILRSM